MIAVGVYAIVPYLKGFGTFTPRLTDAKYNTSSQGNPEPEILQTQRKKPRINHPQRKAGWQILLFYQLEAMFFIETMGSEKLLCST